MKREGRELEIVVNGNSRQILEELKARRPESLTSESLTLEEIFVAALK